jgi:hypothetical protein
MNAEPQSILDVLNRISGNDLTAIVFIFMLFVFVTIVIIAMTIQRMHRSRLDDALKRDLVERGFSADEIARIVESSSPEPSLREIFRGRTPPKESSHVPTR